MVSNLAGRRGLSSTPGLNFPETHWHCGSCRKNDEKGTALASGSQRSLSKGSHCLEDVQSPRRGDSEETV